VLQFFIYLAEYREIKMTRVNLIDPTLLMDCHLFSEFRELKMVPKSLIRSLRAFGVERVLERMPPRFTLNTGHVSWFYNKGLYLANRYERIKRELDVRGVNYNKESQFDSDTFINAGLYLDWTPDQRDIDIVTERIDSRISEKPHWYRYRGVNLC
jgi:deoxyribonuclease (pyrimidine dimer)